MIRLPVTNVVAEMLDGAREHERLLRDAPPYDRDTLDRVERVYRDGATDHDLYREQLARWQRLDPGAAGLTEFAAGVDALDPSYARVLALAAERRGDTIEALHAKSDLQIGVEALLGGQSPGAVSAMVGPSGR